MCIRDSSHVAETVDMCPGMRARHQVFSHVAETDLVWRSPRLYPTSLDAGRCPIVEHLERRMPGEEGHPGETGDRQRVRAALLHHLGRLDDLFRRHVPHRTNVLYLTHDSSSL